MRPWAESAPELLRRLGTTAAGLDDAEAQRRLAATGPNTVSDANRLRVATLVTRQVTSPLVLVLIAAAIMARILGDSTEALVIVAIVVVNASLAFVQEFRAERALGQLRRFITRTARVRRGGTVLELSADRLVPGDAVLIEIGDVVPADIRLLQLDDLTTDEALLTGESFPCVKNPAVLAETLTQPHELTNLAFQGTTVASGYGEGVVIATGRTTMLGRTAASVAHKRHSTDFERNIARFSGFLLKITLAMTAFVFVVNAIMGKGALDSMLFALALAVGITPEALPVIVTIALSNGAMRMARDRVVARRLIAVEDLGNIDVLCCDKTGTLTEGEVALHGFVDPDGRTDSHVLRCATLAAQPAARGRGAGNPIDAAVLASPAARALAAELSACTVLDRNAFDYRRRMMSSLVGSDAGTELLVKGAPEAVLAASTHAWRDGAVAPLDAEMAHGFLGRVTAFEQDGFRVVAVARRALPGATTSTAADEQDLTFRGLLTFLDPARPTARLALDQLRELGVTLKVLSGDGPDVTRRICADVGLVPGEGRVVLGSDIDSLNEDEVRALVQQASVFARVSPEQKARLVAALGRAGHVVGFLGDGVNDVPALRAADVGVAVDSGADVAKEAADIVLLEKSLSVLAEGIREGRKTFGNITKYIFNTVSANFGNMSTVALSSVGLRFIPLLPSQILLNNLLSDLPLVTISTDRVDADFLRRPRRWDIGMIGRFMVFFGLLSAAFDVLLIVGMLVAFGAGPALFRTAWFVESACSEILVTFAIRTRGPFFRSRPSALLLVTSAVVAGIVLLLPYTAPGARYFALVPLPGPVIAFVGVVLAGYFVAAELAKRAFFRRFEKSSAG